MILAGDAVHGTIDRRWPGDIAVVAIAAGLLLWPALLNHFPLIFHDTNGYVRLTPEMTRSPAYKLFVHITGLRWTLWTTIIAQSLLASGLILYVLRLLGMEGRKTFLAVVVLLAVFSSLPVFSSFLMPDIFTGLLFLLLFAVIFLFDRMGRAARILSFALLLLAISSHLSHLSMAVVLTLACGVWLLLFARPARLQGVWLALLACAAVAVSFLFYNGWKYHEFSVAPAGSTFLAANLLEYGPLRDELDAHCPKPGARLCAYRAVLPPTADQFLWDRDSPFNQALGGFAGMNAESGEWVRGMIAHRPLAILTVSASNSARALVSVDAGTDVVRQDRSVAVLDNVFRRRYGDATARGFDASLQERNRFPVRIVAWTGYAGLAASLLAIALLGFGKSAPADRRLQWFAIFVLAAYGLNAVICATVSGVHDRYQARLSWLLVLAAVLLLIDWIRRRNVPAKPGDGPPCRPA